MGRVTQTIQPYRRGFTIVELLIVIVVIAILAAITIVSYNGITTRARESALISTLQENTNLLGIANATNGAFPTDQSSANLSAGSGTTLTYTPQSTYTGFCLQASSNGINYYATNKAAPTKGTCPTGTPTVLGTTGITGNYNANQANTISVPSPSNVPAGTLLVMNIFAEYLPGSGTPAISVPSGFTLASSSIFPENNRDMTQDYQEIMNVYYAYAPASNTASYSVTFPLATHGTGIACGAIAAINGGITSGNPFGDSFVEAHKYGYPGSWGYDLTTPSISVGGDNSLTLAFFSGAANTNGTIMNIPAGWTRNWGMATSSQTYCGIASKSVATATTLSPLTFTEQNSDDSTAVIINSLRPY